MPTGFTQPRFGHVTTTLSGLFRSGGGMWAKGLKTPLGPCKACSYNKHLRILLFMHTVSLHISPWWYSLTQECDSKVQKSVHKDSSHNRLQHPQLNLCHICWVILFKHIQIFDLSGHDVIEHIQRSLPLQSLWPRKRSWQHCWCGSKRDPLWVILIALTHPSSFVYWFFMLWSLH